MNAQWFSSDVAPSRPSVYERDYSLDQDGSLIVFCKWNNGWYCNSEDKEIAETSLIRSDVAVKWREIASEA